MCSKWRPRLHCAAWRNVCGSLFVWLSQRASFRCVKHKRLRLNSVTYNMWFFPSLFHWLFPSWFRCALNGDQECIWHSWFLLPLFGAEFYNNHLLDVLWSLIGGRDFYWFTVTFCLTFPQTYFRCALNGGPDCTGAWFPCHFDVWLFQPATLRFALNGGQDFYWQVSFSSLFGRLSAVLWMEAASVLAQVVARAH